MHARAATPEAMETLGAQAARDARHGTVIALVGDLGAGKTHWTKGFVRALGSPAEVTSPTFGLVHEYAGGRLPVYHFDFYRIDTAPELIGLGWDEYLDEGGAIIAEWGDKFPEVFPAGTRWLRFSIASDGSREIDETQGPPA